jgi:hypothetical protein
MRFLTVFTFMIVLFSNFPAMALSCAPMQSPDAIPQNDLIVRAKVLEIKTPPNMPAVPEANQWNESVTFEILDVYKGPQDLPKTFTANFSNFFKAWGPHLTVGGEGEYLFDLADNGELQYAGPGGCTFVSEKAWEVLRAGAQQ